MVQTGGNVNPGREILHSVCGRWMNVYGAMVAWYWQGETEVLWGKKHIVWVGGESIGMEELWKGTDWGNWSTGMKTLYSVCGRWMNGFGALVDWYWQGETEVLGGKHYRVLVVGEWMGVERWWNGTESGKLKYWEENIIHWGGLVNEWVWSNGWMILTGGNGISGRKTLYSVGGRWMKGYGSLVEWYWKWEREVLGGKLYIVWVVGEWMRVSNGGIVLTRGNGITWRKHFIVWVVDEWMRMERWWNGTDRGILNYWERNII